MLKHGQLVKLVKPTTMEISTFYKKYVEDISQFATIQEQNDFKINFNIPANTLLIMDKIYVDRMSEWYTVFLLSPITQTWFKQQRIQMKAECFSPYITQAEYNTVREAQYAFLLRAYKFIENNLSLVEQIGLFHQHQDKFISK